MQLVNEILPSLRNLPPLEHKIKKAQRNQRRYRLLGVMGLATAGSGALVGLRRDLILGGEIDRESLGDSDCLLIYAFVLLVYCRNAISLLKA